MSVREEDQKKNCSGRGFAIAATALGIGVGAALYYYFNNRSENETPSNEGSTSNEDWHTEPVHAFLEQRDDSVYTTISVNTTTDTSMDDEAKAFANETYDVNCELDDTNDSGNSDNNDTNNSENSDFNDTNISGYLQNDNANSENSDHNDSNSSVYSEHDTNISRVSEDNGTDSENAGILDSTYETFELSHSEVNDDVNDTASEEVVDTNDSSNDDVFEISDDNVNEDPHATPDVHDIDSNESIVTIDSDSDTDSPGLVTLHTISSSAIVHEDSDDWDVTNSSADIPSDIGPQTPTFWSRIIIPISSKPTENDQASILRQRAFRDRSWTLEECSICFDVMLKDQELMKLPCTHNFHSKCIMPWLQNKSTCPVCRKSAD